MDTTTIVLNPLRPSEPAASITRNVALWTPLASFARRMYARARRAGYFRPVRVVIRIQLGARERAAEPYENPEFV